MTPREEAATYYQGHVDKSIAYLDPDNEKQACWATVEELQEQYMALHRKHMEALDKPIPPPKKPLDRTAIMIWVGAPIVSILGITLICWLVSQ